MTAIFHKDMSMGDYQASTDHLSKTMISVGADCWAKFKYQFIDGNYESKDTQSLRIGSAVHTLALEPEKFQAEYYVLPEDYDGRTKEGKLIKAEADETGKTILKFQDVKDILGMADAIKKHPLALGLLQSPGHVESSIFWQQDGMKFKCRPDLMRNDGLIVDLKTCRSAHPRLFSQDAYRFKYDISVALTCRGYEALHGQAPEEYVFLCIETEAPYVISCFTSFSSTEFSPSVQEIGNRRLDRVLDDYRECVSSGLWPEYQSIISPLSLPSYAME
jgi:exodeoxyribonuclease VIII